MPVSVSVPVPALVSPPVPPIAEASVTLLPLVSRVPPLLPSAASCPEMSVVVPVAHCRPPPFSVIWPRAEVAGRVKLIRPPLIVQAPEAVAVLLSVQVLVPVFWKAPKPWYWPLPPICDA